jgi:hypothetical protein
VVLRTFKPYPFESYVSFRTAVILIFLIDLILSASGHSMPIDVPLSPDLIEGLP